MKLHDFLQLYVLLSNTHNLFDYEIFARRFETRYGKRQVRDDCTAEELQNIAQNTLDVNLAFLQNISKQTLDPFKTWGETDDFNAGTIRTNTTTPNLTDTTVPNLTDTTQHRGTIDVNNKSDAQNQNFVNAYDSAGTSNPLDNGTAHGENEQTNTYNNDDTTTHSGTTTTQHTGNTETKSVNSGTDTRVKWGWNTNDYRMIMEIYQNFIDIVIDLIASDILYIIVRGEICEL